MVNLKRVCFATAALALISGCRPPHRQRPVAEHREGKTREKIDVEAYLFDARLRRHGKPTSFRLELFQTDSTIAFGGRAYLGKGALKGRLTVDSLEVYFPSSNEYLYELLHDLFTTAECPFVSSGFSLLHLFTSLPGSRTDMEDMKVTTDYTNPKRPEFQISLPGCPWLIKLTYDRQEAGWRIRNFVFNNGKNTTLKATRRRYKKKARVPLSKFRLAVPGEAMRIVP